MNYAYTEMKKVPDELNYYDLLIPIESLNRSLWSIKIRL